MEYLPVDAFVEDVQHTQGIKILVRELRLTAKDVKVVKHSIYVAKKKELRIAMSVMNFHVKNLKVGLNVGKNMDKILLKIRRY